MRTRRRVITRRRALPRRLRYHRATRWVAATAVVVAVVGVVQHAHATAADAQRRWGETREVAVARRDLAIGTEIGGSDVELQSWPVALLPDDALDTVPSGRTVVAAITRGEAIVKARVAPDGVHGITALVPDGFRALAIPVAPSVIALAVGDRVDLIAGFDVGTASSERAPTLIVGRNAVVVAVDELRVTVAVPAEDAERVAFAIVAGTVVPALVSARR